jgi:hypothetical protein
MDTEMVISTDVTDIAVNWLEQLRAQYRPQARRLNPQERLVLGPFFNPTLIEDIRVMALDRLSLISDEKIRMYFPADRAPIDLKNITGLTLVDTICVGQDRLQSQEHLQSVLFQEMVHATQFRKLGVRPFLEFYIEDWACGGMSHDAIALERQALALRQRFDAHPEQIFSVERELAHV